MFTVKEILLNVSGSVGRGSKRSDSILVVIKIQNFNLEFFSGFVDSVEWGSFYIFANNS